MNRTRGLCVSPNGVRWLSVHDEAKGCPFVQHEAAPGSGRPSAEIELGSLLVAGGGRPEHLELPRSIATLAKAAPLAEQDSDQAEPAAPFHSRWVSAGNVG